jgi:hypothetical protein
MNRFWLLTLLYCVATATSLTAQTNYVALSGVIMDPHHLAIPYAGVTLISVATAEERKVKANAHGEYEIGALLPGSYLLVAESKGFAVAQRSLQLEMGQQVTLDVTLKVGPNTETVTAVAAAEPLEGKRRSPNTTFSSVVVHHIENHLDAGLVKSLHHVTELVQASQWVSSGGVPAVGRKERHRAIAPVVLQTCRCILGVELEDRHQLNGSNPQILQVRNLLDQSRVRTSLLLGNAGVCAPRESANVHLIEDSAGERMIERPIALPVIHAEVCDDALGGSSRVVPWFRGNVALVVP